MQNFLFLSEIAALRSRIERKDCLISTSYLAGLFNIFILLHIWQLSMFWWPFTNEDTLWCLSWGIWISLAFNPGHICEIVYENLVLLSRCARNLKRQREEKNLTVECFKFVPIWTKRLFRASLERRSGAKQKSIFQSVKWLSYCLVSFLPFVLFSPWLSLPRMTEISLIETLTVILKEFDTWHFEVLE